jgi:hypothetical protein
VLKVAERDVGDVSACMIAIVRGISGAGEASIRVLLFLALSSVVWVSAISAGGPVPVRPPTGYRDYCDGGLRTASFRCPKGGVPASFWRPLRVPSIPVGGSCPVSQPARVFRSLAPVIGLAPVYLLVGGVPGDTMTVADHAVPTSNAAGTGWETGALKVPFAKGFHGALLIRGRRLDAPGLVGFSGNAGRRPYAALQVFPGGVIGSSSTGDVSFAGGFLWVTSPGCYLIQFDGAGFSSDVVFSVRFVSTPYDGVTGG